MEGAIMYKIYETEGNYGINLYGKRNDFVKGFGS